MVELDELDLIVVADNVWLANAKRLGIDLATDPLILDERFLCATVGGQGVSASSHAGIVNAATAATLTADAPLDVVLGGDHLAGSPRIGP